MNRKKALSTAKKLPRRYKTTAEIGLIAAQVE